MSGTSPQNFKRMNPLSPEPTARAKPTEALRQQLLELDNRFTLLGGTGLFDTLDKGGVLDHRVEGAGDFDYAASHPPLVGRARLRGDFVRANAGKNGAFGCDWMNLWDGEAGKLASLADPFCNELHWRDSPTLNPRVLPNPEQMLFERVASARRLCESGSYPAALQALERIEPQLRLRPSPVLEQFLTLAAALRSRCGLNGATEAVAELAALRPGNIGNATVALQVHLHLRLAPCPESAEWLQEGEALLARTRDHYSRAAAEFQVIKGAFLNRSGRAPEAVQCLERILPYFEASPDGRFVLALALAEFGESHRLLGNRNEACHALRRAQQLQNACGFRGELGRRTMLYRAKLERSTRRSRFWLGQAERVLQACGDRVGLLKSWLLLARLASSSPAAEPLKHAIESVRSQLPAIQPCPKLQQILRHWTEWCEAKPAPDGATDFFWTV